MNRLDYYRLRNLSENRYLSETEFQIKYSKKRGVGVNFKQTNNISDLNEFKKKMNDIKYETEKKTIEW